MRPHGTKPRFGVQGQHRPISSNQNSARPQFTRPPPPFHEDPRQSRTNRNQNKHTRLPGPYGATAEFNGPMRIPNRPMMGSNRPMSPMMMPCGPIAPPVFMDPSSFNMMMRTPPPGIPMPMRPMLADSGFSYNANGEGPPQPAMKMENGGVQPAKANSKGGNEDITSNEAENFNYSCSQFGVLQGANYGWQGNAFPGAWNFGNPYPQYSNQGIQTFYQNYDEGYNQNFDGSYNQYYHQGQSFMQGDHHVKQEHTDLKLNFNQNNNQNGAFGAKNASKNKKRKELSLNMRKHYCDTCDKSFLTEEALATHISEHKVCGLDECKFTAHPKVVEKHQQMQHFTGLYRRIGSLYTPEDIEKWRKDRKKNYPTPHNVEERRAKQEEMFARGERMRPPNNRFSPNNQQRNGRFPQRQHCRSNRQNHGDPSGPRPPPPVPAESPKKWKPVFPDVTFEIKESEERSGIKPFPGTAAFHRTECTSSSKNGVTILTNKTNIPSSLSFLCMYGTSSSEEDSDTEGSKNDSSSRQAEESSEGCCRSEPTNIVEDRSLPMNTEDSISPKPETPAALESTPLKENIVDDLAKEEDDCSNTTNEPVLSQSQGQAETKDGEGIQEVIATKEESNDSPSSFDPSYPSLIPKTSPSSLTKGRQTNKLESAVTDPKTLEEWIHGKARHETESFENAPEDSKSTPDDPTNKLICKTASVLELSEKMNGMHDCSDDSGPEEVPISRDSHPIGDDSADVDGEVNSKGGGNRKRRKQPRQPLKKQKTDEKPTNKNQPQQQPCNKNQRLCGNNRVHNIHRPPLRRAPTLLEKLLSKEICHERNVILQCVRYVVENNYFRGDRASGSEKGTS